MTPASRILDEDIDIPGYNEGIPDPTRLPPYAEDLGNGVTHGVDADGTERWYQDGKLHRDGDLPAVVTSDGYRAWYQHGKFHRDGDKPAVIDADGFMIWYKHDNLRRDGGKPVIEKKRRA